VPHEKFSRVSVTNWDDHKPCLNDDLKHCQLLLLLFVSCLFCNIRCIIIDTCVVF